MAWAIGSMADTTVEGVTMKLQVGVIVALALVAGPAMAQGYGTWAPGQSPPSGGYKSPPLSSAYAKPATSAPSSRPKTYGAPEASTPPAFKPYQGSSTYSGRGSTSSLFGPDGKKKR